MLRRSKIFIALLLVLAIALPSFAAAPANPYSNSRANFAKPIVDWWQKYVYDKFTGFAGGYGNAEAPFDTVTFSTTPTPDGRPRVGDWGGQRAFYHFYEEIIDTLESLPKDYMRWDLVGSVTAYDQSGTTFIPHKNFGYPIVVFSKGPNGPVFDPVELRALGKPIYFMGGSVHATEYAAGESIMTTIRRLARDEQKVLDKISVVAVPRLNHSGSYWANSNTVAVRGQGYSMNLGSDGGIKHGPDSRLLHMVLNAYKPHAWAETHQWSNSVSGGARYYASGVYGQGSTTAINAVTVPANTMPGASTATVSLNRQQAMNIWAPIDLGNKFHNTPDAISDWQDRMIDYVKQYFWAHNTFAFEYPSWTAATYARNPNGVEVVQSDGTVVKMPGDVQQLFRLADCIPDERYADGAIGMKQMVGFCSETPSNFTIKAMIYGHFLAQEAQMKFVAENAQQLLKDVENSWKWMPTDRSDVALWTVQTFNKPLKHRVFKVINGEIADPATGDHYYEYNIPFHLNNYERKAGPTITRPYAYIIDPDHVADGQRLDADLMIFRLSYVGMPIYRLTAPVTVQVEGSTMGTVISYSTGNTLGVSATPALATFDEDGNYTGAPIVLTPGPNYLGGPDSMTSTAGLQDFRIINTTTEPMVKTFPAGSYVVPVSGSLADKQGLDAILHLDGKANHSQGSSYLRFRPGHNNYNNNPTHAAEEWPHRYWQNFIPVAAGSSYPAYRYMSADYEKALKLEPVFAAQPFLNGANFAAGYPVNLSILKEKGFNTGGIQKIGMAYNFKAEGTSLVNNAPANPFYVTVPLTNDGVALKKWFLYDWSKRAFVEASTGKSRTSGADIVNVAGSFIGNGYDVALVAVMPTEVLADAWVEKLNGNKNNLFITVTELYPNGAQPIVYEAKISIDNNAAGTYQVGPYKVYVDTKGNTQIRACYIVK